MNSTNAFASIEYSIKPTGFGDRLTVLSNGNVVYQTSAGKICVVKAAEFYLVLTYTRGVGVRVNVFDESFEQKATKAIEFIADLVDAFYSSECSRLIIVGSNYSLIFPFYPQEFKGGFPNPPADALRLWGEKRSYSLSPSCFGKLQSGKVIEVGGGLFYIVEARGAKIVVGLVDGVRCRQIAMEDFPFEGKAPVEIGSIAAARKGDGNIPPLVVGFSRQPRGELFAAAFFAEEFLSIGDAGSSLVITLRMKALPADAAVETVSSAAAAL